MKFLIGLLAVLIVSSPQVAAQAPVLQGDCDPSIQEAIEKQLVRVDSMLLVPESVICVNLLLEDPDFDMYAFDFGTWDSAGVAAMVEVRNEETILTLVYYSGKGTCPANPMGQSPCVIGWLNDKFLQTGYADTESGWTPVQEKDPEATIAEIMRLAGEGLIKRVP